MVTKSLRRNCAPVKRDQVKTEAAGRWLEIITALTNCSAAQLNGRKQPCPKCGGNDRFRSFADFNESGGVVCSQCHDKDNRDGFATIQWLNGWSFPDTVRAVAERLGLVDESGRRPVGLPAIAKPSNQANQGKGSAEKPAADSSLEFQEWNESLAAVFCIKKQGIKPEALKAFGARIARYQKRFIVIALPIWGPKLDQAAPVGWIVYNATGGTLPSKSDGPVSKKITWGSDTGILGTIDRLRDPSTRKIKTEGPTDGLALLSLVDESTAVFCNACGAIEKPEKEQFAGLPSLVGSSPVISIGDADKAGEDGAARWGNFFASFTESRIARLPYEVVPSHGKDLRDWIAEGNGRPELEAMIAAAELVKPEVKELAPVEISNFTINVDEETVPKPVEVILSDIQRITGGWPKVAGGSLFAMSRGEIVPLPKQSSLFAWMRELGTVNWRNSCNLLKEGELFETMLRRCDRFDEVLLHPHFPSSIPGIFYACEQPAVEANGSLDEFLAFFNPSTSEDLQLMKAAVVTLFWNGGPGQRVGFIVSSTHGQGGGKTVFVHRITQLVGGPIELSQKGDIDDAKTRILSPGADRKRSLLVDNVKSSRFGSGDFEALITAPIVSGHRMYQGEACRRNYFTFFLTMNSPAFSRDTAQRFVNIVLGSPQYDASWHSRIDEFLANNRDRLLSDIASFFERPKADLTKFNRWGAWQGEILARLDNAENVSQLILARECENDSDRKGAEDIEEHIRLKLANAGYTAAHSFAVHIPATQIAEWVSEAMGENYSPKLSNQLLDRLEGANLLYCLSRNKSRTHGRGFIWKTPGYTGAVDYRLCEVGRF